VTDGAEWRRRVRRVQADRAAARRRHPASGLVQPDRPGMLRAVPAHPDYQPPTQAADTTDTTKETDMPSPANPPAGDRHDQLRALLAQADDYAAALEEIARDDPRRLLDVARQMTAWHAQLATVLFGVIGTPEAERGVMLAGALTDMAEAVPLTHANPTSRWEHAARLWESEPTGPDEA
jgi:hypothetical protein